jgi:hypothetical protein
MQSLPTSVLGKLFFFFERPAEDFQSAWILKELQIKTWKFNWWDKAKVSHCLGPSSPAEHTIDMGLTAQHYSEIQYATLMHAQQYTLTW